jgi:hypothetical protein
VFGLGLLLAVLGGAGHAAENGGPTLPFRLLLVDYDAKLESILLSGEFENTLDQPLAAFRGRLKLTDAASGEAISVQIDCGMRRHVPPEQWGVCSVWLDLDPDDPSHAALQHASAKQLEPELRLLRVLYTDGTEEGF